MKPKRGSCTPKGQCVLHLSEHHGDCSPGSAIRIETADIDAFHADLASKDYKYVHNVMNPRSGAATRGPHAKGLVFALVRSCFGDPTLTDLSEIGLGGLRRE